MIVVDANLPAPHVALDDSPIPEPGVHEVIVATAAASVRGEDFALATARGDLSPMRFVPGGEIAGVVAARGAGVRDPQVGDRVCARVARGALAERVVLPERACRSLPAAFSFEAGVALARAYPLAYRAVCERGAIAPGEFVVVHQAESVVGGAAIELARARDARVLATAATPSGCERARREGAEWALPESAPWVEEVNAVTDGRGADLVIDPTGGERVDLSLKRIAWNGRFVAIERGSNPRTTPRVKLNRVMLKNIAVWGLGESVLCEEKTHEFEQLIALLSKRVEDRDSPLMGGPASCDLEALPRRIDALRSDPAGDRALVHP